MDKFLGKKFAKIYRKLITWVVPYLLVKLSL